MATMVQIDDLSDADLARLLCRLAEAQRDVWARGPVVAKRTPWAPELAIALYEASYVAVDSYVTVTGDDAEADRVIAELRRSLVVTLRTLLPWRGAVYDDVPKALERLIGVANFHLEDSATPAAVAPPDVDAELCRLFRRGRLDGDARSRPIEGEKKEDRR